MRKLILLAATLALPGIAQAEMWKDYTPAKGLWQVSMVRVDPNHIDDYLVGLKQTWLPGQEAARKLGMIDDYKVMVSDGQGAEANVLLMTHVTSYASLEPNRERDQQIEKEAYAATPKTKVDAKVADYEKYRSFVGGGNFGEMTLVK